jgi:hypothetical protein
VIIFLVCFFRIFFSCLWFDIKCSILSMSKHGLSEFKMSFPCCMRVEVRSCKWAWYRDWNRMSWLFYFSLNRP